MIRDPAKCAARVFNGRGRGRLVPRSILNVNSGPTHRKVRKQVKNIAFLLSVNPAAAVKQNQRRSWPGPVLGKIKIEFQLEVVGFCIGDVWKDVVITTGVVNP